MVFIDNELDFILAILDELQAGLEDKTMEGTISHFNKMLNMCYERSATVAKDSYAVFMMCAMAKAYAARINKSKNIVEVLAWYTELHHALKVMSAEFGII